MDPERVTRQDSTDPSGSEIFRAIKTQSVGPRSPSSAPPTVWFHSRLSELDAQLAALQNIADYLEMDFSNSRMLVNTIEKLTPVLSPEVKTTTAVKKTVRLTVPQEAWMPHQDTSTEPNVFEEDEENEEGGSVVNKRPFTSEWKPSFLYSTSSDGQGAGPSNLHSPPKMDDQLAEASGISQAWEDENLGQTGLSDTAEILEELVKEGYLSLTDLDLSNSQTAHHSSRPDEQQSSWRSQKRVIAEEERRELRIWMRRKQRERLAVYQKHRESLRERERKPFSTSAAVKPANKNQGGILRARQEKQKLVLLDQYNQRTKDAITLASDFLTNPRALLSSSQNDCPSMVSTTRSNSAPPPGGTYRVYDASANDKRSLKSGQAQHQLRPRTAEVQERSLEEHRRRLGLHRPVTCLPKDRLSLVTRRGMVSNTKLHTVSQSGEQRGGYRRKTEVNRSPSGQAAVGRGIPREPASELNRLLGPEDTNRVLTDLLSEQEDGATAGVSDMDWLDGLSETGSNLSKIDWAAIERMVAAEEA